MKFQRQTKYYDPLIYTAETPYQTIDVTEWQGQRWFYYNNVNQFSSIDHWLYFEPMAHVPCQTVDERTKTLVIGGENGMLIRELLKYNDIDRIDLLPVDSELLGIARQEPIFLKLNDQALNNDRIRTIPKPIFSFLEETNDEYNLIYIDLPDPLDLELNQYYTTEFYQLCYEALRAKGVVMTQAGSPYYAPEAFYCINRTVKAAGFSTLLLHNQVLTLGEWGWVLGIKGKEKHQVQKQLFNAPFDAVQTKWLNQEAVHMMTAFVKQTLEDDSTINDLKKPIVHIYYTTGTWQF